MNNFLPTSRKDLSTFQTNCPDGVQVSQTVVHFAHFQVQARKRDVWGWGWGCFVYVHIPERVVWRLSKDQGLVVVFWAEWDPIWAKWDPSGQSVQKVNKSALELGNSIITIQWNSFLDVFASNLGFANNAAHTWTSSLRQNISWTCFSTHLFALCWSSLIPQAVIFTGSWNQWNSLQFSCCSSQEATYNLQLVLME